MAKFKTISGEKYRLYSMHYTKSGASEDAKKLRSLGYKARIQKGTFKGSYNRTSQDSYFKVQRSETIYRVYRSEKK